MRCKVCDYWNRVAVDKIFIKQLTPEPKAKAYVPMYNPLQLSKCKKYGEVIAKPKEHSTKNRKLSHFSLTFMQMRFNASLITPLRQRKTK